VRFLGFEIRRVKATTLSGVHDNRGWSTVFDWKPGAWQQNAGIEINEFTVMSQATVFACMTLIASDIGKLRPKLMQKQGEIWVEIESPAFSPLLRKPNQFQTWQKFVEGWVLSKLSRGNTVVAKERDDRSVVRQMHVLDWGRVTPLIANNGSVFYRLGEDQLSKITADIPAAPASEVIHDRGSCLFHPLVGVSPIFACGLAAMQAMKIQQNSAKFFENMSRPSGILTAPAEIKDDVAKRLKDAWETNFSGNNIGKVAVLGDGLKYESMSVNPVDAQLVEQLKLSAEQVCSVFHVPSYMVGAAPPPPYNNVEALHQQYYSQCLQALIESIEASLDEGLGLGKMSDGKTLGIELDLDGLLRMDSATHIEVLSKAVGSAIMAPDEARQKRNLPPVKGGATPYLQQQNYSLEALAKRDAGEDPFGKAQPPAPPATPTTTPEEQDKHFVHEFGFELHANGAPEVLFHA